MKKLFLIALLFTSFPLFGQATTGYHRVSQVIARSNSGTVALVVPFAKVSVTNTATGIAAVIYSDPLLSSPIASSLVTADLSGNYGYYMPLNTCNTEFISAPGQSNIVIPNICGNPSSSVLLQTNGNNNGLQNLLNLVAGSGIVLNNTGGNVVINSTGGTGVTSVNLQGSSALTGAVVFTCGSGLTCFQSGQTISIALTGNFAINSFSGCGGSFELGASNTNPVCTATYSTTPASANITNTDGIDSPLTLTTPFTSGTIVGTFTHNTITTVTATLTAVGASTQTATQTMTWNPRSFGGVGAAGATSSVTASGTTAVLSNSVVLSSIDLAASNLGSTYGPFTTTGNNVYLLLIGGSHTFVDTGTGFPFTFNAPTAVTFVNANGVSVNMFLYQSTNALFGTFNIKVAS